MTKIALVLCVFIGLLGCENHQEKIDQPSPNVSEVVEEKSLLRETAMEESLASGKYQAYSDTEVLMGKPHVLFFYADWCPTCRIWQQEIQKHLDELPEHAKIYTVNYDDSSALKRKYAVNMQSTAVFLDAEGNKVKAAMDPDVSLLADFFKDYQIKPVSDKAVEKAVLEKSKVFLPKYVHYLEPAFEARLGKQIVALYFKADWCPTCQKFEENLLENIQQTPENFIMFKANFDTETALRKTYKVNNQTTVIVFDAKGEEMFRAIDPPLETLVELFKQA